MSSTKEATDLVGSRRRVSVPKAGSVWESRMKLDQVKGGIKVFDATATATPTPTTLAKDPPNPGPATSPPHPQLNHNNNSMRRTWKSDNSEGTPIPILHTTRQRSESTKNNSDQQFKEIGASADEMMKKSRSEGNGENDATTQQQQQQQRNSDLKKIKSDRNPLDQLITPLDKKVLDDPKKPRSDDQDKEAISSNVGRRINTPSDGGEVDLNGDEQDNNQIEIKKLTSQQQQKPKKFGVEEKKPVPANRSRFNPIPTKTKPNNISDGIPRNSGKLQTFVDLVMWKEVSKSAFVFGIGTFAIVSSSFTKGLNISFISVVSYMGLVYLAANFLFRSFITRGSVEMPEYVVGEEEAIWVMKLILPYVNEFLVKLRALFSGDPATTMKLAVLLFVLAQCGNSITIWKMAKLGFFGVFTVPKVCSSYSSQITAYGTFWIHRFMDAWDSCSHKKLVGFVVFTLIWNLASLVARVWIVFMSFVALKYYQQSICISEESSSTKSCSWQQGQHMTIRGTSPSSAVTPTQKKVC